jgi:hypothetical protein
VRVENAKNYVSFPETSGHKAVLLLFRKVFSAVNFLIDYALDFYCLNSRFVGPQTGFLDNDDKYS